MRISIIAALTLATAACGGKKEQTFEEGLAIACSAPDQARDVDPSMQVVTGMKKVADQITNPEVKALLGSFAAAEGRTKADLLREAVHRAHLNSCALLEAWSR